MNSKYAIKKKRKYLTLLEMFRKIITLVFQNAFQSAKKLMSVFCKSAFQQKEKKQLPPPQKKKKEILDYNQ